VLVVSDTNEPATWFNWAEGHPRAFFHRFRDCVRMGRNGGRWSWHETPCSTLKWKYRFICQYGKYFTRFCSVATPRLLLFHMWKIL